MELQETDSSYGDSRPVLEWGFAGTSHNQTKYDQSKMVEYSHSIWEHWIDSRTDEPSVDEGDLWPQPNGDVLESGTQVDPITGAERKYEELWGDVPVKTVDGEDKRVSLVLKVDDKNRNARGLVVRLGQFCQGILQVGNKFTVERWEWINLADKSEPGPQAWWRCKVRIGDSSLPCDPAMNTLEKVYNGVTIQSGQLEWRVIEDYRW